MGCVIACVIGIFLLRIVLVQWNAEYGAIITSIVNAVQIQILNFVYGKISIALNDFENYRTETEYANALIIKSFLFKFVNCIFVSIL